MSAASGTPLALAPAQAAPAPAAQAPSGMEQAQALADQVRAEAMARAARAEAAQAAEAASVDPAQAGEAAGGFQVGPGGEILPGGPPPPPPEAITVDVQTGDAPPDFQFPDIPDEFMIILVAFFVMIVLVSIGGPIARAYARRIDRRGADESAGGATAGQLRELRTAVEAMSIEVERISENQRFVTRLLTEGDRPAGAPSLPEAERVPRATSR